MRIGMRLRNLIEHKSMIKEQYVSFEIAKLLKEKGFPQEYDIYHSMVYNEEDYEDEYEVQRMVLEIRLVKAGTLSSYPLGVPEPKCYCPTQQMTMQWLREKHNIHIGITFGWVSGYNAQVDWAEESEKGNDKPACCVWRTDLNTTYEAAVEAAIKYCLEEIVR